MTIIIIHLLYLIPYLVLTYFGLKGLGEFLWAKEANDKSVEGGGDY